MSLSGKKCRKSAPNAPTPKELLIHPEICRNTHFGDLGPSWGLDGGPDSQNHQNQLQNHTGDIQIQPNAERNPSKHLADYGNSTKTMAGVPPCISYLWKCVSAGRVPASRESPGVDFGRIFDGFVPPPRTWSLQGLGKQIVKERNAHAGTVAGTAVGIGYH